MPNPETRQKKIKNAEQQLKHAQAVNPNTAKIGETVRMRVVSCAGDPGLSEPWYFDILSRFLICMREPVSHVPTNDKAYKMFFLVRRPRHLWVDASGGPDNYPDNHHAGTRRKDYLGNINIGHPSGYTINTIPNMDTDYSVGDVIVARKISPEYATDSNSFVSMFLNDDFANYYTSPQKAAGFPLRGSPNFNPEYLQSAIESNDLGEVMHWSNDYWTEHGGGLPASALPHRGSGDWYKLKPLIPASRRYGAPVKLNRGTDYHKQLPPSTSPTSASQSINNSGPVLGGNQDRKIGATGPNTFSFILHFYVVDLALREFNPTFAKTIDLLSRDAHRYNDPSGSGKTALGETKPGKNLFKINKSMKDFATGVPSQTVGDGRFLSQNQVFSFCEWEDANEANRQRTNRDDCMPLVIASPNNFPIPKERKIGSIIYEPAYATVVAAQQNV